MNKKRHTTQVIEARNQGAKAPKARNARRRLRHEGAKARKA